MYCQRSLEIITWGPWTSGDLRDSLGLEPNMGHHGYGWEGIHSFHWICKLSQDSRQINNHSNFLSSYLSLLPKCSRWYLRTNGGKSLVDTGRSWQASGAPIHPAQQKVKQRSGERNRKGSLMGPGSQLFWRIWMLSLFCFQVWRWGLLCFHHCKVSMGSRGEQYDVFFF